VPFERNNFHAKPTFMYIWVYRKFNLDQNKKKTEFLPMI